MTLHLVVFDSNHSCENVACVKPHKVKVDAMKYGVNWIQNHVGRADWNFLVTHFLNHIIHHESLIG